jgi:hypothetical protein
MSERPAFWQLTLAACATAQASRGLPYLPVLQVSMGADGLSWWRSTVRALALGAASSVARRECGAPRRNFGAPGARAAAAPGADRRLAAQDGDLMPEHQDLRILGSVAAGEQRQPAEQLDHEQVDKADEHERRA